MSAGICVMNRHAAVLAADSAFTIGNHLAIRNSGNKLFALSKLKPVGVIFYNAVCFMNIPVENIIKEYKNGSNEKDFGTLTEYVEDFLASILNNKNLFRIDINEPILIANSIFDWLSYFEQTCKVIISQARKEGLQFTDDEIKIRLLDSSISDIDGKIKKIKNPKFAPYIKEKYQESIIEILTKELTWCKKEKIDTLVEKLIFLFDIKDENVLTYTGLLFCGYGKDEIFPSAIHLHIFGCINGELCYNDSGTTTINEEKLSAIIPVAQDDVMNTFILGINDEIYSNFSTIGEEILKAVDAIDDDYFATDKKQEVRKKIMDVVAQISAKLFVSALESSKSVDRALVSLQIDDMINFAQSMINITSIRRLIPDKISGTVGGPVDIAVITKSDGFIWKQRKHYFDGDKNPQYFYSHYMV